MKYICTSRDSTEAFYTLNGEEHAFVANYGTFSLPADAKLKSHPFISEFKPEGYQPPAAPEPFEDAQPSNEVAVDDQPVGDVADPARDTPVTTPPSKAERRSK